MCRVENGKGLTISERNLSQVDFFLNSGVGLLDFSPLFISVRGSISQYMYIMYICKGIPAVSFQAHRCRF